jgi:hypothetical protein
MNASTACVTKRVASTALGNVYGPWRIGAEPGALGQTAASTMQ